MWRRKGTEIDSLPANKEKDEVGNNEVCTKIRMRGETLLSVMKKSGTSFIV